MTEQDQAICANPKLDRAEILTNVALSLGWGVTRMTDEDKPSLMFEPPRASGKRAGIVAHIDKLGDDAFAELLAFFHHGPPANNNDGDDDHAPHCIVGAIDRQTRAIERTVHNHDLRDVNLAILGLGEKILASEERQTDRAALMMERLGEMVCATIRKGIKADTKRGERYERSEQAKAEREERKAERENEKAVVANLILRLDRLEKALNRIEGDAEEGTNPVTEANYRREIGTLQEEIKKLWGSVTRINNDRP